MSFIDVIKERAKSEKKKIVLPETGDPRTLEAADTVLREGIADIILVGNEEEILSRAEGLDLSKACFVDPNNCERLNTYIESLCEARKSKGLLPEDAKEILLSNPLFFGATMVRAGDADGMVAGAVNSSANVLRSALQVVKTAPGTRIVSAFFLMVVPDCELGANGTFVFADCGLNQNPNSEQLAAIAGSSAQTFKQLVGEEPRVAMLSHSTVGSAKHDDVTNVPVFPDLDAGNIGYKLVQRLAKAEAYGPVTQGIAKPVNDLSRGCKAEDIVGVVAITAVQAQLTENN